MEIGVAEAFAGDAGIQAGDAGGGASGGWGGYGIHDFTAKGEGDLCGISITCRSVRHT